MLRKTCWTELDAPSVELDPLHDAVQAVLPAEPVPPPKLPQSGDRVIRVRAVGDRMPAKDLESATEELRIARRMHQERDGHFHRDHRLGRLGRALSVVAGVEEDVGQGVRTSFGVFKARA